MISPRVRLALALVERAESLPHASRVRRVLLGLLAVALACAVLVVPVSASAQRTDVDRLMRTVWSECGVDCSPPEIAALHHVIAGIADREGVRWSTAWRLASPRLAEGSVSRRWLADIDARCEEPSGWPRVVVERDGRVRAHPPWSAYRTRCVDLAFWCAAAIEMGVEHSPCVEAPRSWGSDSDVTAREALSDATTWVDVDCGETSLRFGAWRGR